jgi:hypothetical protein
MRAIGVLPSQFYVYRTRLKKRGYRLPDDVRAKLLAALFATLGHGAGDERLLILQELREIKDAVRGLASGAQASGGKPRVPLQRDLGPPPAGHGPAEADARDRAGALSSGEVQPGGPRRTQRRGARGGKKAG